MFRTCVLSLQRQAIFQDLKIFAQYSSKSISGEKEKNRQQIIAYGKQNPEFSTLRKKGDEFFGFTKIPFKNQYHKMYFERSLLNQRIEQTLNLSSDQEGFAHEKVLNFISRITRKIAEKDTTLAQDLTTECFNKVTEYQRSKNFQNWINQRKLKIHPDREEVLLVWCDEQKSNEKSVRLVMLTFSQFSACRNEKNMKNRESELMQQVEQKYSKDYRKRYELQKEKGKVKEKISTHEDIASLFLQHNDILVWNFDFLKPDVQMLQTGKLKVQSIAVVKLENCVHQEEHAEWKRILNASTDSKHPFHLVFRAKTSTFLESPIEHTKYFFDDIDIVPQFTQKEIFIFLIISNSLLLIDSFFLNGSDFRIF